VRRMDRWFGGGMVKTEDVACAARCEVKRLSAEGSMVQPGQDVYLQRASSKRVSTRAATVEGSVRTVASVIA
jgi:hypothetical protein